MAFLARRIAWLNYTRLGDGLSSREGASDSAVAVGPSHNHFRLVYAPRNEYAAAWALWGLSQTLPGLPVAGGQTQSGLPGSESGNRRHCCLASRRPMRTKYSQCAFP